jgi:serine protease Do
MQRALTDASSGTRGARSVYDSWRRSSAHVPPPFGELFKRFFKDMPEHPTLQQQGTGSGVIMSADGYILTNNHVVAGAKTVTVTLADEQEYAASVIGGDPKTDLAVIKITAKTTLPASRCKTTRAPWCAT